MDLLDFYYDELEALNPFDNNDDGTSDVEEASLLIRLISELLISTVN